MPCVYQSEGPYPGRSSRPCQPGMGPDHCRGGVNKDTGLRAGCLGMSRAEGTGTLEGDPPDQRSQSEFWKLSGHE